MQIIRRCLPNTLTVSKGVAPGASGLARWKEIDDTTHHTPLCWFRSVPADFSSVIFKQRFGSTATAISPSGASDEPYAFAMQTLLRPGYRHGKELLHLQCSLYHALRLTGLPSLNSLFTVSHHYSTAANEEHLLVRKEAGLGRITINRPKALNAKNCGAPSNNCLHCQAAVPV